MIQEGWGTCISGRYRKKGPYTDRRERDKKVKKSRSIGMYKKYVLEEGKSRIAVFKEERSPMSRDKHTKTRKKEKRDKGREKTMDCAEKSKCRHNTGKKRSRVPERGETDTQEEKPGKLYFEE